MRVLVRCFRRDGRSSAAHAPRHLRCTSSASLPRPRACMHAKVEMPTPTPARGERDPHTHTHTHDGGARRDDVGHLILVVFIYFWCSWEPWAERIVRE